MRDFFEILSNMEIYNEELHNMSDHTYRLGSNLIEFVSLDQPQKKRGAKRNYLWMNEANEFTFEDYLQMSMRTSEQIFMDYNPSEQFHWIYDLMTKREDFTLIKSTYKDNTFLDPAIKKELEMLQTLDENSWNIYGLGNRGKLEGKIYSNYQIVTEFPECEVIYGLDFGYNNPTALTKVGIKENDIYIEEVIYQSYLTNQDLIQKMKEFDIGNKTIYCDHAEPQRIEELYRAGFNVKPADKSVKDGIDRCKRSRLHVLNTSINALKEIQTYKYKVDKNGKVLEEPIKFNDHICDSFRYAIHTHQVKPSGKYFIVGI